MTPVAAVVATACAFAASVVSGVAGFGGAAALVPILTWAVGARAAVPVLTIAVLIGNLSRIWVYRRSLDLRVAGWFCLGAVPFAALGAVVYAGMPVHVLSRVVGGFLLLSVVYRRLRKTAALPSRRWFAPVGAVSGFLAAIVGAIGPLMAPFFLRFGLVKEAYVGTTSLSGAGANLAIALVYGRLAVLGRFELAAGLWLGAVMACGSWAAGRLLGRMSQRRFVLLVEFLLVVSGVALLRG